MTAAAMAAEVPKEVTLTDGRTLMGVTAARMEGELVRLVHASGVSRHALDRIAPESRGALSSAMGVTFPEMEAEPPGLPERLTTLAGRTYEEVSLVRATPSGLSLRHKDGVATVRFDDLDEAVRAAYGYDPEAAARHDREQAEANARRWALEAAEDAAAAREGGAKAKARAEVAERIGNRGYWTAPHNWKVVRRSNAMVILTEAGYTEEEAAAYVETVIRNNPQPAHVPSAADPPLRLRPAPNVGPSLKYWWVDEGRN